MGVEGLARLVNITIFYLFLEGSPYLHRLPLSHHLKAKLKLFMKHTEMWLKQALSEKEAAESQKYNIFQVAVSFFQKLSR